MGADQSSRYIYKNEQDLNYCSITFSECSEIHFGNFPNHVLQSIKTEYEAKFGNDFEKEKLKQDIFVKITCANLRRFTKNKQFSDFTAELLCSMMRILASHGYSLCMSAKLKIKRNSSSWIFRKAAGAGDAASCAYPFDAWQHATAGLPDVDPPVKRDAIDAAPTPNFCCIVFKHFKYFKFINMDEHIVTQLTQSLDHSLPGALLELKDNCKAKLKSSWISADRKLDCEANHAIMRMIAQMQQNNYELITANNVYMPVYNYFFFKPRYPGPAELTPPHYVSIRPDNNDRMYVIDLSTQNVALTITQITQKIWSNGVKEVKQKFGNEQIVVHGIIWSSFKKEEIPNRCLIANMFQELSLAGWTPFTSFELNSSDKEMGTLILRSDAPRQRRFFCICPIYPDKMYLVNAADREISQIQKILLEHTVPDAVKIKSDGQCVRFKLPGFPVSYQPNSLMFHYLIMLILNSLQNELGLTLATNFDSSPRIYRRKKTSNNNTTEYEEYSITVDSIWFYEDL